MEKKYIFRLMFILVLIVFTFLYAPYHNEQIELNAEYYGVVAKKYYQRGNTFDIKQRNGTTYTVPYSIYDSIYKKAKIGDSIKKEKENKIIKMW